MAEMVKAEVERAAPKERKKLDHIRVKKAKGGGHMVEHHFASQRNSYSEPEPHVFGKDEGDKLLAHVGKVMGIPGAASEAGEEEHKNMGHEVEVEE